MSLLDDVSIVVTPNGVKASKLYAVIPSNGDADMDVTRATAATRVDEDGLVNYAQVISDTELITNGDFATDTDWTKNASWTIANGKASYDGSGNGDRIKQNIPLTIGKKYTASLDILDSSGRFRISVDGGSSSYSTYTTGNGTYTFEFTSSSVEFSIRGSMSDSANTFSIDNVSVKEVTRDNVPRIDYTGGGCPHILAEPQRTNLITYSEDLTNAFYLKTGIETVIESTTLSPDGTSYGYTIIPTSATSSHFFDYQWLQLTVAIGVDVTYSVFIKPNGYNFIQIASSTGFASKFQNFELTGDGVIGTGDVDGKTIEKIGDYYRVSVTQVSTGANPRFLLIPSPTALATRNASFTGNGTDGVLGWGVQVEEGSYSTSYIPTSGSTVTRNRDIFTRDGIGILINSTEGVLFVEMAALANDGTNRYITLSDGSQSNSVRLYFLTTDNTIAVVIRKGGSSVVSESHAISNTLVFNKFAVKWKEDDVAVWVNGTEVDTEISFSSFSSDTLNKLNFSRGDGTTNPFFGKVKQLQVFKTALTDSELATLTT